MYVNESILAVVIIISDAIDNDGEARMGEESELVNTEELRHLLEMPRLQNYPLVSDCVVDKDIASKVAFCSAVKKHNAFATTLADILIGALCIKVPRIRTLCGGTGPSKATLHEWSVFDVDSVIEYSSHSVDGIRALLMVVKNEFITMSFDTFTIVKDMVQLFVTGQGVSVAREQIDRVTRELEDLVDITGEHAADHLRSFVTFCV